MKDFDLNAIKTLHKKFKNRSRKDNIVKFNDALFNAFSTMVVVTDHSKRTEIRNEARKNLIVNLVTAFEVYLNNLIVARKGKWNVSGVNELLKTQGNLSLPDAIDLFKKTKNVIEEHIIVHYSNFQNYNRIDKSFALLTSKGSVIKDKGFFDLIGEFPVHTAATRMTLRTTGVDERVKLNTKIPNWKDLLREMLETRNLIIHENINKPIKIDVFEHYVWVTDEVVTSIEEYCKRWDFNRDKSLRYYGFD